MLVGGRQGLAAVHPRGFASHSGSVPTGSAGQVGGTSGADGHPAPGAARSARADAGPADDAVRVGRPDAAIRRHQVHRRHLHLLPRALPLSSAHGQRRHVSTTLEIQKVQFCTFSRFVA